MFSLNKILVLAAIILAVWYGFKLIARLDRAHRTKQAQRAGHAHSTDSSPDSAPDSNRRDASQGEPETVTLVRSKDGKTFAPRREDSGDSDPADSDKG